MKLGLLVVLVGVMVLAVGVPLAMAETGAFHDAADLTCNSCHTMHYSEGGAAPTGGVGGPNSHLLMKKNTTDLCLSCHSDASSAPDVFNASPETPGGDFNNSAASGSTGKGHNPYGNDSNLSSNIAPDDVAGMKLTPPGGTGALSEFTCTSCHDAHGDPSEAFMYRNLLKASPFASTDLTIGDAEEAPIWNGTTANLDAEADASHNVYRLGAGQNEDDTEGFGAWCATCHGNFHGAANTKSGGDWIRHPTNELITGMATAFGKLSVSGKTFIPMETTRTTGTFTTTTDLSTTDSDATTDQVFCLSCHRAHASDNANATRWDNAAASGSGDKCNRCHAKGS